MSDYIFYSVSFVIFDYFRGFIDIWHSTFQDFLSNFGVYQIVSMIIQRYSVKSQAFHKKSVFSKHCVTIYRRFNHISIVTQCLVFSMTYDFRRKRRELPREREKKKNLHVYNKYEMKRFQEHIPETFDVIVLFWHTIACANICKWN